jgi:peptidyl-prolyl cis-trans isomerase SurA
MAISKLEHMQPDVLSEPFKADNNTWMILKYTKTKEYDAAKEIMDQKALEAIFAEKAAQIYKTWLASMKDDAYITILDKNLKIPEVY